MDGRQVAGADHLAETGTVVGHRQLGAAWPAPAWWPAGTGAAVTNRHMGYVVALDKDLREDDAEATINALRMVKGVLSVTPVETDGLAAQIAEHRVHSEVRTRLYEMARDLGSGR